MKICILSLLLFIEFQCDAQKITILDSGTAISCRGLSVWNDNLFWVSGSNGSVGVSYDAGNNIHWQKINGFENRDFRDIHVFSPNEIIIMAIDNPALILKSMDSGSTWKIVFELNKPGIFLDAMDFTNELGYCIGDPMNNQFFILKTKDKGNTWQQITNTPIADCGEACFASSGSNIIVTKKGFAFVSGGLHSYVYDYDGEKYHKISQNLSQGTATSGANAIAKHKNHFMIVGGDFNNVNSDSNTFFYNKFKTWRSQKAFGYKSSILHLAKNKFIACGTSGVVIGKRKGKPIVISNQKFHVVKKAMHGKAIFLAGGAGKIGKLML
jgi:photosystem II stability/assembly factor-like uncharacterized protein